MSVNKGDNEFEEKPTKSKICTYFKHFVWKLITEALNLRELQQKNYIAYGSRFMQA